MRNLLCFAVLAGAACTGTDTTPEAPPPSSAAVSDRELARNVSLAFEDAQIPGREFIRIDAKDGIVTLGGSVPSSAAWTGAVNAAMRATGVRDVDATGLKVVP